MRVLSRQQVRQVDRLAIQELGIPGVVLMENAGRGVAAVVLEVLGDRLGSDVSLGRVVVLAGGGNNGGDGYVIARHLYNHGVGVTVCTVVDPFVLTGDAATHYRICQKMGLPVHPICNEDQLVAESSGWGRAHVLVDALLGTGFSGTVRPHLASVIQCCNDTPGPVVVAVDVPSGLDCDTGSPSNATVRADHTITFVAPKPGLVVPAAAPYVGRVVVADIGLPPQLVDRVLAMRVR